ncbi:MAG: hypothetical protein KC505_10650 [Myxococcales bacterium]|nr:hypothetical protein [Myxococcales bacterium]USN49779.1 MAG: hypothetical protein H6731_05720 [Myxococcales bacterium]
MSLYENDSYVFSKPPSWSKNALNLAKKRFLFKSEFAIDDWFYNVAKCVCSHYAEPEREYYTRKYTQLLQSRIFLPTSSALANTIYKNGIFAGCMVFPLPTNLEEIFNSALPKIMKMLLLGVGVGLDLSHFPPRSLPINSQASLGPIQTLITLAQAVESPATYQGIKRAAFMATLFAQHPDIFEFISMKRHRRIENINISLTFDTALKKSLEVNGYLPLFWQNEGSAEIFSLEHLDKMKLCADCRSVQKPDLELRNKNKIYSNSVGDFVGKLIGNKIYINTQILLDFVSDTAHACGDPGLINLDAINQDNPTHPRYSDIKQIGIGSIKSTTPCGEQPLLPYEVCHLGSFNLKAFIIDQKFNKKLFSDTIKLALRLMDDLICSSNHGLDEINRVSVANRKVGLGVMGLADALAELEIPYDSDEALKFCEEVSFLLQSNLEIASEILADERGVYPNFKFSRHANSRPRRHATLSTIAPTGHIATLADCSFGIEPYYLIEFDRNAAGVQSCTCSVLEAKLQKINYSLAQWIADTKNRNPYYEFDGSLKMLSENIFSKEEKNHYLKRLKSVFKTAHEIDYASHLNMVSVWQKHVENGISKTINLSRYSTREDVKNIFSYFINQNLKGITVFRDRSLKRQALYKTKSCINC